MTVPKSYCPDPETLTIPEIAGASIFHILLIVNYYQSIYNKTKSDINP